MEKKKKRDKGNYFILILATVWGVGDGKDAQSGLCSERPVLDFQRKELS
jgi:hypothetical protein